MMMITFDYAAANGVSGRSNSEKMDVKGLAERLLPKTKPFTVHTRTA
jgi:hypothetical protein